MNFRQARVGNLIQEELGKIIQREMEFPGALVTITSVEIDKKLDNAKVSMSVIPKNKSAKILEMLDRETPRLQHQLLKKINIKPMPRIKFEIDFGAENAASVEKIIVKENLSDT
jgi:ribosome-binding factor A